MTNPFKSIGSWFSNLSPIVRNIMVLGLFVLFFIIVISIINAIKKASKKSQTDKTLNDDIKKLIAQGQTPSYPDTTYKNLADKIFGASRGWFGGLGTDEEAIKDTFKEMKNELDVVMLEKAFGAKEPADCWAFCDTLTMGDFLAYEMSAGDIAEINKTLASKNINIRF